MTDFQAACVLVGFIALLVYLYRLASLSHADDELEYKVPKSSANPYSVYSSSNSKNVYIDKP